MLFAHSDIARTGNVYRKIDARILTLYLPYPGAIDSTTPIKRDPLGGNVESQPVVEIKGARFDDSGNRISKARITVLHNGVAIHENLELEKPTGGTLNGEEEGPGPLLLQDHGNPVRYRNIWVRPVE